MSPTSSIVVVADTTPLNYLILIGKIDLLNQLYKRILVPPCSPGGTQAFFAEPFAESVRRPRFFANARLAPTGVSSQCRFTVRVLTVRR